MNRKKICFAIALAAAISLICLIGCTGKPTAKTAKGAVQLFFDSLAEGDIETAYCLLSSDVKILISHDFTGDILREMGYQEEIKPEHQRAFMALLIGIYNSFDIMPIKQEIEDEKATVQIRFDIPDVQKIFKENLFIDKNGKLVEDSVFGTLVEMAGDEQGDGKLCAKANVLAKSKLPRNKKLEGPIYFHKDDDGAWRLTFPNPESDKFNEWAQSWEDAALKAFEEEKDKEKTKEQE